MLQKKVEESTYHLFYPFFLILFLTAGVIIAENVAKNQNFHYQTEVLGTTIQTPHRVSQTTSMTLIALKIKIEGIGKDGNMKPKNKNRTVTVIAYQAGTQFVTSGSAQLTYDNNNYFTGVVHLKKLHDGLYFIKIIEKGLLQVSSKPQLQKLVQNKINTIPLIIMAQGDINNNGVLDQNDYALELSCFQNYQCITGNFDFDDDGKIDIKDFNIFMQSFNAYHEK